MVENPNAHYHATKRGFGYTACGDPHCTRPQVEQRPLRVPQFLVKITPPLVKIASGLLIAGGVVWALIFVNYLPRMWHDFQRYPQTYDLCWQQQPASDTVLELLAHVRECHQSAGNAMRGPKGK
jgi:hypothetical protein